MRGHELVYGVAAVFCRQGHISPDSRTSRQIGMTPSVRFAVQIVRCAEGVQVGCLDLHCGFGNEYLKSCRFGLPAKISMSHAAFSSVFDDVIERSFCNSEL